MKIKYDQWVVRLNAVLEKYQQKVRVVDYGKMWLKLNTGDILTQPEFGKFKRRLLTTKTTEWGSNMDKLISGELTEANIKSLICSVGGKTCQKLHGDRIKHNLNQGSPWNKGKSGVQVSWSKGLTKDSDPRIAKFAKFGEKNGMFGKTLTQKEKQHRSKIMKHKILEGTFTPNSNNRNTHWDAVLDKRRYRSSWEAWYHYLNPVAKYEVLRIRYAIANDEKVYIVDFIDNVNKNVVEVKPVELTTTHSFKAKWTALCNWSAEHGYTPLLVDKEWLIANTASIDYTRFDTITAEKIRKIYETSEKN